jgi:hypothetical protein
MVRSTIHRTGMLSGDVTRLPECFLLWLTMHSRISVYIEHAAPRAELQVDKNPR